MNLSDQNGSEGRAKEYLAGLQMQTYQSLGLPPPPSLDSEGLQAILASWVPTHYPELSTKDKDEHVRWLTKEFLDMKRVSIYEDPLKLNTMQSLARDIEGACLAQGLEIDLRPILGTLPSGQVNALTFAVPGTRDHLVVFDPMLFTYSLLFSKAVALSFPPNSSDLQSFSTEEKDVAAWIESSGEAVQRFREVIHAYALGGNPDIAPPYFPAAHHAQLAAIICASMELFVMGHEYGHVLLKHLLSEPKSDVNSMDEAEAILYSWRQEYSADAMGLRLAIQAVQDSGLGNPPFAIAGAELFLWASDVMDKTVSILATGNDSSMQLGSHPSAESRRDSIRAGLIHLLGENAAADSLQLADSLAVAVNLLWAEVEPSIWELRAQGRAPAPIWLQRLVPQQDAP